MVVPDYQFRHFRILQILQFFYWKFLRFVVPVRITCGIHTTQHYSSRRHQFLHIPGIKLRVGHLLRKIQTDKGCGGLFCIPVIFPATDCRPHWTGPRPAAAVFRNKKFDYDATRKGLFLIAVGLFKKIVIADRLAVYVDSVYGNVAEVSGLPMVMAVLFFCFQLYLDFSAYSQIAIGTAQIFLFTLYRRACRQYRTTRFCR